MRDQDTHHTRLLKVEIPAQEPVKAKAEAFCMFGLVLSESLVLRRDREQVQVGDFDFGKHRIIFRTID